MSRPTKLTPEVQKRLCDAIGAGNYLETACRYAGVDYATFRRWMVRGKHASRGRFREFREAVKKAESEAEVLLVALWRKQTPDNWQAARDLLERRYPKRWGRKTSTEQTIKGDKKNPLVIAGEAIAAANTDDLKALNAKLDAILVHLDPGTPGDPAPGEGRAGEA